MIDRTQKRCVATSAFVHLALVGIVLFAPASKPKEPELIEVPVLPLVGAKVVDDLPSQAPAQPNAAENPAANLPPPLVKPPATPRTPPPAESTQPPPQTPPKSSPPPEPPAQPKSEIKVSSDLKRAEPKAPPKGPNPTEAASSNNEKDSKISHTLVKASKSDDSKARAANKKADEAREKREAEEWLAAEKARQDIASQRAQKASEIASRVRSHTVTGTDISVPSGTGDVAQIQWYDQLKVVYERAWFARRPESITADVLVVRARITIARDGTVLASQILEPSGLANVDRSVQRVLSELRKVPPFPEGAKDSERTVTINFRVEGSNNT